MPGEKLTTNIRAAAETLLPGADAANPPAPRQACTSPLCGLAPAGRSQARRILFEAPPQTANWLAVNDRLRRAPTLHCPVETQPKENTHEKAA